MLKLHKVIKIFIPNLRLNNLLPHIFDYNKHASM